MCLEQQLTVHVGDLHGIVDQPNLRSHRHEGEQRSNIFRVHTDAAVGDGHSNRHRIVRAVKHITAASNREPHGEVTQGVVGTCRDDFRQRIAVCLVLFADRFGGIPGRMFLLGDDPRLAERRAPVHLANAHRVGDHDGLFTLLGFRKIVQPVLRQIHHHALVRTGRQDAPAGQQNVGARTGQPHVNAGIGADDLLVSQAVASRNVEQRVLVGRLDPLVGAEHRRPIFGKLVHSGPRRAANRREHADYRYPALHVTSLNTL